MDKLKNGDIIKSAIVGVGKKGNPFANYKGKRIYIQNHREIQFQIKRLIKIKITKSFEHFAFGEIIK